MSSDEDEFIAGGGAIPMPTFDPMAGGDCSEFVFMDYPHGSREYIRFIRFWQMKVGQ
ncbi:hypothetical protein Hanom_Chr08g00721441 [Helianthus anomalus]